MISVKQLEWQPMDTAPKGEVTEDAGCRGASEWFLGRVAPKYAAFRPPYIVIRRRAWPQEDSWSCAGEADYVPAFFDAWAPLSALTNTSGDDEAATIYETYEGKLFSTKDAVREYCDGRTYALGMMGWSEKKISDRPARPQSAAVRDGLEEAIRNFMPLAEVAFLWTKETPPKEEVDRYREAYWSVQASLYSTQEG